MDTEMILHLNESQRLIFKKKEYSPKCAIIWISLVGLLALIIILFFASALMPLLNFAMVLAFLTTPIFALLNYRLVTKTALPIALRLSNKMKYLSWAGLTYLYGFLGIFIWWKWFL
ncbi:hypothetical protein N9R79_05345 [Vibrio sp.]|nr:hypothetical protein [Vibrio sp.]